MDIRFEHEDDGRGGRFVLYEAEQEAGEITYQWAQEPRRMVIDHTGVDGAFGGKGYAKLLVKEAIAYARAQQVLIQPLCSFVVAAFDRDESLSDLRY